MSSHNHLLEILEALVESDVHFIIAGGVAIVLQGVERATMDLDLSVRMEADNLQRFLKVMKNLGLSPRVPVPAESLLIPAAVHKMFTEKRAVVFTFIDLKNPFRQVDIFLDPKLSFESLVDYTEWIPISGKSVRVLSKEALIRLKRNVRPPRDKDQFDIQALEKLLRTKPLKR